MRNKGCKSQWEHYCEGLSIEGQTEDLSLRLGLASTLAFSTFYPILSSIISVMLFPWSLAGATLGLTCQAALSALSGSCASPVAAVIRSP